MEERKEPITIKSTKSPLTLTHILLIILIVAVVVLGVIIAFKGFGGDKTPQDGSVEKPKNIRYDDTMAYPNANKKYSDILEIPYGLDGYFDLDEAIAAAKAQNKPIFVDVTGHACNNCRKMETSVWSDPRVMYYLKHNYIICALYVDDMTELAEEDYYTNAKGIVLTELGPKNFFIANERWDVISQPCYVLVTPDGEAMLTPAPFGYERDVDKFAEFLQTGLKNKAAGINYATAQNKPIFVNAGDHASLYEEPYEIKGSVEDMNGDANISWEVTSYRVEDGRYKIRFVGEIEDGYHGYPMDNFSAPMFYIREGDADVASSEISEPLADQLVDHHGKKVYKGNVEYVFYVDGNSGEYLQGSVMATICSDEENLYTIADHSFEVRLQ
jgi:thioredoxin-related protein